MYVHAESEGEKGAEQDAYKGCSGVECMHGVCVLLGRRGVITNETDVKKHAANSSAALDGGYAQVQVWSGSNNWGH